MTDANKDKRCDMIMNQIAQQAMLAIPSTSLDYLLGKNHS